MGSSTYVLLAAGYALGKSWAKQLSLSIKENGSLDEQFFQFRHILHFISKSYKLLTNPKSMSKLDVGFSLESR